MTTEPQVIYRRLIATPFIGILPTAFMPLFITHPFADAETAVFVCGVSASVFALLVAIAFIFRERRPLVRIDGATMTVFGPHRTQPHSFALSAITQVTFDARPGFWRNALRLTVHTDGVANGLCMSRLPAQELARLDTLLQRTFGTRYQRRATR